MPVIDQACQQHVVKELLLIGPQARDISSVVDNTPLDVIAVGLCCDLLLTTPMPFENTTAYSIMHPQQLVKDVPLAPANMA